MLFLSFLRLGVTAFGGPAMIAFIKELAVNKKKWLAQDTFQDGVSLCQSIPGATAMQMAAYVGLKTNGLTGALLSYIGFGVPAFILMLTLSIAYANSHSLPQIISLFNGLQVIVVAIIANAAYSFGRDIFRNFRAIFMALISASLLWLGVSPFIVILGAALTGVLLFKNTHFPASSGQKMEAAKGLFKQFLLLSLIIIAGLIGLYLLEGKLLTLALLMMKIDLFAFGGAFASIPLMLYEIVDVRGWMDSKTLMDGIALGQITPGPIVITAAFVGYLMYGFKGALVATIAIFTPSFLILTGIMPFYDRVKTSQYFLRASKSIFATFVGLLLFATLKFASAVPWDAVKALLLIGTSIALFKKIDILYVVLIGSAISILIL